MPAPASPARERPLVASICGTFLKPEMLSIYRQVTGLRRFDTLVFTEERRNEASFPFASIELLTKLPRPKPRGNFLLRFWFRHVVKQWPPPFRIEKDVKPYYPFDLLPRLDRHQPDLLHIYYGHKAVTYRSILLKTTIPYLVSFHGVDVAHFARGDRTAEFQEVLEKAALVLARSQSLLDELERLGVPRAKLRLNRTPIPLANVPSTVRVPPPDASWRLVQACRLIPKKGILTTLTALKSLIPDFPLLHFTICGTGPQEPAIRQAIDRLGLSSQVHLAGWLDQDALRAQFAASHVFLHPSELTDSSDQEGIPNSMLEAMASALPVVATRHGGIPEAVRHESEGLLVPEKSPAELASALRRLFTDPSLLSSLSARARLSALEQFDAPSQVAALEDLYDEALKLSQTSPPNS